MAVREPPGPAETWRKEESYRKHYDKTRAAHIKTRLEEHAPRAVFFYGLVAWCQGWWESIADVSFDSMGSAGLRVGSRASTVFVITKHPAAHGVDSDYFRHAGQQVKIRPCG